MPLFGRSKRPKEVELSDYSVREIMEFIDERWIALAGHGWQGYDGAGRGFVFVDFEDGETKYIPASNPHIANPRDPYWGDVRNKMKKYNPESEVVVVFHQFVPGNTTSMQLSTPKGMPKPREAAQLLRRYQLEEGQS